LFIDLALPEFKRLRSRAGHALTILWGALTNDGWKTASVDHIYLRQQWTPRSRQRAKKDLAGWRLSSITGGSWPTSMVGT
jgi:hypothetical protein